MAGIPLPGLPGDSFLKGVDTGSSMFSRMIQPVIQREQLAQQWQQHLQQKALQEQQLELQRQQEQRLASMTPYQIAQMEAAASANYANANLHNYQSNPEAQVDFIKMLSQIGGSPNIQGMQSEQDGESNIPNPFVRGALKKFLGVDPFEDEADFQSFVKKENFKNNVSQEIPTNSTITANQSVVTAANTVLPVLEKLAAGEIPGKVGGLFSADKRANFGALSSLATDELMTIFNLPSTAASVEMVHELVTPRFNESTESVRKRIKDLIKRVEHKRDQSHNLIKNRKVTIEDNKHGIENKNKNKIVKTYNPDTDEAE
jgi:hypothetical protein